MTWISVGILLTTGLGLMAFSWNGAVRGVFSPGLMVLFWILMSASGIYLFMLAVKKAHRLMIHEERRQKQSNLAERETLRKEKKSSQDKQSFDFTAVARKLVRRTPEGLPFEEMGKELFKNLAKELEIMSAILYVRKLSVFKAVATYALASPGEPYSFKEGEGLTGQVAANQHVMVLTNLPKDHLEVYSGLGKAEPAYLAIVPLIHKHKTIAVLECSGYKFEPGEIESMFRIFSRDLMEKISPDL